MKTFADIKKAAGRKRVVTFVPETVPAGHFAATITVNDRTASYLLEGAEGDAEARIKGRVALVPSEDGTAPGTLAVYKGSELEGGEYVGYGLAGHRFDESFLRLV